jgi:hypothetical protein
MAEPFDPQGHILYCPAWADMWEQHHGRDNLDAQTRRNLDEMRTPEKREQTRCPRCRINADPHLSAVMADWEAQR